MLKSLKSYWDLLGKYVASQRNAIIIMTSTLLLGIFLQLLGPQIMREFIDSAQAGKSVDALMRLGFGLIFTAILQQVSLVISTYWGARVSWFATNALRIHLTKHLLEQDLEYHKLHSSGEMIERIDGDVSVLGEFFSSLVVKFIGSLLVLLSVLISVCWVNLWAGLALGFFSGLALFIMMRINKKATPAWVEDRSLSAVYYGYLGEVIDAAEDIRSIGAKDFVLRQMFSKMRHWMPVRFRAELGSGLVWMTALAVFAIGDGIAYGLGGGLYRLQEISLGTVYMIVAYAAQLAQPLEIFRVQVQSLQNSKASIERVRELLMTRSKMEAGTEKLPYGPLSIEFCSVGFKYSDLSASHVQDEEPAEHQAKVVLSNLSFKVGEGKILGIVGGTGSGKSTIARLLCRMYDPQSGEVRLNNQIMTHINLESIRKRVGYVTQDVQLFTGTIRDNITFADSSIEDTTLIDIFERLGIRSWYNSLPDGLDTVVSSATLSAGEAQLLSMTRVFLKDPGLIILDEVTSRLDPIHEKYLEYALDGLLENRTAIIIAHRITTLDRSDDILFIKEGGQIIEYGGHNQLIASADSEFSKLRKRGFVDERTSFFI